MRNSAVGANAIPIDATPKTEKADPKSKNSAEDITDRASNKYERAQSDQAGVHNPLLCTQAAAELFADRWERDIHDRAIQEGHERTEYCNPENKPLSMGQRR